MKKLLALLCALLCLFSASLAQEKILSINAADYSVTATGQYSSMEEVAVYLTVYGKLPGNFITKREAEGMGWDNRAGNLSKVAPGCSIGGDRFGNYEKSLPDAKGRKWTECDIGYTGGHRGSQRIVFSSDGLIYYTGDHYNTFTQLVVTNEADASPIASVAKDGIYTDRDQVAAYLHQYGRLPSNYLTRDEAKKLGWTNKKDNLRTVAPGCAIGGDSFQNREKQLPDAEGRQWYECDVNLNGAKRGKERLVYSSDGLIYYTPDNHRTFTQLY